jgi:hypothetical protein
MSSGAEYRAKAAELFAKAQTETDQSIVFELHTLARAYLRLAEHADARDRAPIIVTPEAGPVPPPEQIPRPEESTET